jgi:hypothetical protein
MTGVMATSLLLFKQPANDVPMVAPHLCSDGQAPVDGTARFMKTHTLIC